MSPTPATVFEHLCHRDCEQQRPGLKRVPSSCAPFRGRRGEIAERVEPVHAPSRCGTIANYQTVWRVVTPVTRDELAKDRRRRGGEAYEIGTPHHRQPSGKPRPLGVELPRATGASRRSVSNVAMTKSGIRHQRAGRSAARRCRSAEIKGTRDDEGGKRTCVTHADGTITRGRRSRARLACASSTGTASSSTARPDRGVAPGDGQGDLELTKRIRERLRSGGGTGGWGGRGGRKRQTPRGLEPVRR